MSVARAVINALYTDDGMTVFAHVKTNLEQSISDGTFTTAIQARRGCFDFAARTPHTLASIYSLLSRAPLTTPPPAPADGGEHATPASR